MELIDILDEKGNKTGKVKPRNEVHRDGDWHRTVHVWFFNSKNEILLQRRGVDKEKYPDMWDISVAGHISSGEDSIIGACREVEEETGVKVNPGDLKLIGEIVEKPVLNNKTYFDNEFHDVYVFKIDYPSDAFNIQKSEVQKMQWISISEFKNWVNERRADLVPHQEEYLLLFEYIKSYGK